MDWPVQKMVLARWKVARYHGLLQPQNFWWRDWEVKAIWAYRIDVAGQAEYFEQSILQKGCSHIVSRFIQPA
jgi:hypothetical protein